MNIRRRASRGARVLALAGVLAALIAGDGCSRAVAPEAAPVLLFAGTGTSANDVAAVEALLKQERVGYATATSAQLNAMSMAMLRRYQLLIVPGGDFEVMGNSLSPSTTAAVHQAVQGGLHYLGICAGALLAGSVRSNGLNLTSGVKFAFYSASARGLRKTVVPITTVEGPSLDQYWEDGPQLSGWGSVVARYPDGTPAVVQGASGQGWVILTGIHAEAPESWRRGMEFRTPASVDNAYAATLIDAALHGTALPHF